MDWFTSKLAEIKKSLSGTNEESTPDVEEEVEDEKSPENKSKPEFIDLTTSDSNDPHLKGF